MSLNQQDAYNLFHRGILALSRVERQGMRVDVEYVENKKKELTERINEKRKKLRKTNFYKHWKHRSKKEPNINSNVQLGYYLYNIKGLTPVKFTQGGAGSTDEEALRELNVPELDMILDVRKLEKARDTYLNAFDKEAVKGYIHPFFNLHIARTFRSSSDSPNFQNIPTRDNELMNICRRALFPRPGHQLLEVDYGALEVRIAACYNKDPTLINYIKDPSSDMHGDMAQQIFMLDKMDTNIKSFDTLRKGTKNGFVFPQFYGDYYGNNAIDLAKWGKLQTKGSWKKGEGIEMPGGGTLSDHMRAEGIKSINAFKDYLKKIERNFWDKRFPVYQKWKEEWWNEYNEKGYVDLLTGFRCKGLMTKNDATNYPIQGSAFHCLLWSLIKLDEVIQDKKLKSRIISQIHDSLLLDVHPKELDYLAEIIRKITCEWLPKAWPWIIVPLDIEADICEIDNSWAEKEKFSI